MSDAAIECLQHGDRWRSSMQAVCNQLRGRYIPNKFFSRISKLVCPCNAQRFQDNTHEVFEQLSCKELAKWFEDNIFSEMNHGLMSVEDILKRMLGNITPQHASRRRFLVIVRCAVLGDLEVLKGGDVIKNVDKKQKYKIETEIEIDIPKLYVSFLIGKNGCHIQPICKQYNCEINFMIPRRYPLSTGSDKNVKTVIKINSSEDLERVKDLLIEKAEVVIAKRKVHEGKMAKYIATGREFARLRALRREQRREDRAIQTVKGVVPCSTRSFLMAADELKDENRETFERKSKHSGDDRKHRSMKILEEGSRCMNCLVQMRDSEVEECRYHPGYLRLIQGEQPEGKVWSCCGELLVPDHGKFDQQGSHIESGCETGLHNWRPTKNNTPKRSRRTSVEQD